MARTKASRLSQAGRRGWTRASAIRPGPRARGRRSLRRRRSPRRGSPRMPETPSTSDSPPTQPPTSADRASDDDARVARSPRDAFAALVAPRATRRAPVRDRPTDNLPGVHAASGVPALARQAPRRNPESRRRQRRAPCASRDTSTVRPHPRAPARPRPRVPSGTLPARRVPRTRRGGDAAFSVARRPAKYLTPPVEYPRERVPRASFLPHPRVPCLPPWTGFASPKPSARCW